MFVFIFVVEYLFVALWSAVCRPKYVAGCASASRWGWHSFLVALWLAICRPKYFAGRASGGCRGGGGWYPFCLPCGRRPATRNILLVAVPRGTTVHCCLSCGRRSVALRILLPRLLLNHLNSQQDDTRPLAPRCKFRRRRNSPPLRTAARNKSARLGESPRSTHER